MDSFNSTRPNPYAYWYADWHVGRLHTHDSASPSADFSDSQFSNSQWRTYQRLELLPFSERPGPMFSFGLSWTWRKLLQLLVAELVEKQRVDYLERCWIASDPGMPPKSPIKQFLTLIR